MRIEATSRTSISLGVDQAGVPVGCARAVPSVPHSCIIDASVTPAVYQRFTSGAIWVTILARCQLHHFSNRQDRSS
jgi:hypothetical protein